MGSYRRFSEVTRTQMWSYYCLNFIIRFLGPDIGMALKLKYLIQALPLTHLFSRPYTDQKYSQSAGCSRDRVRLLLLYPAPSAATTWQQSDGHGLEIHRDYTASAGAHITAKIYCSCNRGELAEVEKVK